MIINQPEIKNKEVLTFSSIEEVMEHLMKLNEPSYKQEQEVGKEPGNDFDIDKGFEKGNVEEYVNSELYPNPSYVDYVHVSDIRKYAKRKIYQHFKDLKHLYDSKKEFKEVLFNRPTNMTINDILNIL